MKNFCDQHLNKSFFVINNILDMLELVISCVRHFKLFNTFVISIVPAQIFNAD